MAEMTILYRLIILQILNESKNPLSNTQITNFILEKDYTSYFTVQQSFKDLLSSGLVISESTHSNTIYQITDSGRETLQFFNDKISDMIKADIKVFLDENEQRLESENNALSDYYKTPEGKYNARLRIRSNGTDAVDLTVNCANKEQAEALCRNWKEHHIDAYIALMDLLLY